ncbi:MAG: putative Tau-tubulin kinase 1 [Streblomastix strix]|uniref:non-specific serine/threonine protein kinase n=1 Tax=Streblomastix strix TaxID=222440 RepID=A0A5J4VIS3_9EUKA|nr:MAG: putative Tau-tubulin kinase 1 [Streblomastix strix]
MLETCQQFQSGDITKDRYTIVEQIGGGLYSAIFKGICKNQTASQHVAIKFQNITLDCPQLTNEILILQALADCKHFAQIYGQGIHKKYKFVAMELLGPSLHDLVNRKIPNKFCLHSILKFGVQAIDALQALHKIGFIHRDLKPSNFVIGSTVETSSKIYLIGFGISQQLNIKDGNIIKPSTKDSYQVAFRYASINAHLGKEFGRNDDLMSLIYILVELYTGSLPWANVNNPDEVLRLKEQYQDGSLLAFMPPEFKQFEDHILSLDYTTEPDYQLITSILFETY